MIEAVHARQESKIVVGCAEAIELIIQTPLPEQASVKSCWASS